MVVSSFDKSGQKESNGKYIKLLYIFIFVILI